MVTTDLTAIVVWGGLTNLQSTFTSTILDIINEPGLQNEIVSSLHSAKTSNLDTFSSSSSQEWTRLRSAMFESIRLCSQVTGPARLCNETVPFVSQPELSIPKGKVATLSAYYTHRQPETWGTDARKYVSTRFLKADPPIGQPQYITWGLAGPHTCPGRWFGQAAIQLMVKVLLEEYEFEPDEMLDDEDKYIYSARNASRKQVGIDVRKKS
jgi:peroxidase